MLRIQFGEMENVGYGPGWFKHNYDPEWFLDPFVQKMIEDVDNSKYAGGLLIESPVLGPISPERLSGGVQTLIMIYKMPKKVFDATSCGNNCAKWLLEIGKTLDVTVNLKYLMHFDFEKEFDIFIVNSGKHVHTYEEYLLDVVEYV